MQKLTDWNSLWRELVEIKAQSHKRKMQESGESDVWAHRAHKFKEGVNRRWEQADSSREFIISQIDANSTVLDIGAGTGAWASLLSPHARLVTAVEPSDSMIAVMRESLTAGNITNVSIVQGAWPDVFVEPHDFSLCSHAMYGYPDLAAFVLRMIACTRQTCFLLLRAPSLDSVRAEAARHIWGQPIDSPSFTIAYNILLQMGIYPNVLMEDTGFWKPKTSDSLENAFLKMKGYIGIEDSSEHDAYLMGLLRRRLQWQCGKFVWPPDIRSALVYWKIGS